MKKRAHFSAARSRYSNGNNNICRANRRKEGNVCWGMDSEGGGFSCSARICSFVEEKVVVSMKMFFVV